MEPENDYNNIKLILTHNKEMNLVWQIHYNLNNESLGHADILWGHISIQNSQQQHNTYIYTNYRIFIQS